MVQLSRPLKIRLKNFLNEGVEIFTPRGDIISFVVEKLYDEEMNPIDVARHPEEILHLYVPCDIDIDKDSMMRIKVK